MFRTIIFQTTWGFHEQKEKKYGKLATPLNEIITIMKKENKK